MVIIGASGHAKVIHDILQLSNIHLDYFYDDKKLVSVNGIEVKSPINLIPKNTKAIIGIGNNRLRKYLVGCYPSLIYQTAFHPKSIIDNSVTVSIGTVVMASATVNNSTSIGAHCIINTSSIIDHDCKVNDFVHISPGATLCGGVQVGLGSNIGANSVIIPNIKIGKWVSIGAGCVIINDIPDYAVVVGNPGKIIKYNEK